MINTFLAIASLSSPQMAVAATASTLVHTAPFVLTTAQHSNHPKTKNQGQKTVAIKQITKVKFGSYQAELRLPDGGVYAGEEIDIEFRVVDTRQKDPVEEGYKGVGGIKATGVISMPSMPGMPDAIPEVHREGIPGDYGVVCYFPHGGEYRISLDLDIPGHGKEKIAFVIDVADERPVSSAKPPFSLKVLTPKNSLQAGRVGELKMQVVETKTGKVQTAFDVAHEMEFHLLLASKDMHWFVHEHPKMQPDGTWSVPIKFPAGGSYWVYGDVAPKGKGSRVLIGQVDIKGGKPTWKAPWKPSSKSVDSGLTGVISNQGGAIPMGKTTTLQVKLFDSKTGMPATDTVPWLGAAGHLMIFHKDGQTVVHSHPKEDEENSALVKKGIVRFSGRFPKPGLYRAYAQFDWRGGIRTLGFTVEVKE